MDRLDSIMQFLLVVRLAFEVKDVLRRLRNGNHRRSRVHQLLNNLPSLFRIPSAFKSRAGRKPLEVKLDDRKIEFGSDSDLIGA